MKNNNQQTYVCGEFNIDLIKYKPLINKPTRITAYSSTLIDNIFTNELDLKHRSGVVIADISDHLPIIINSLSIKNLQINSFRSHKRNMLHKDKFIDELKNTDWDFITNCTDVNSSYNTFIDFFLKSLDKHCPYESKLIQIKHNKKPWLSKSLITACKKKNFLYKCFLSKKTVKAESKYKLYKNMLTTILRRAEKTYYDEFLSQNKSNIKKTWGTINFIINKNFESAVPLSEFNFDNKIYKEKRL